MATKKKILWSLSNIPFLLIGASILFEHIGYNHEANVVNQIFDIIMYGILIVAAINEIVTIYKAFRDPNMYWRVISSIRFVLMMSVCVFFWYINNKTGMSRELFQGVFHNIL